MPRPLVLAMVLGLGEGTSQDSLGMEDQFLMLLAKV